MPITTITALFFGAYYGFGLLNNIFTFKSNMKSKMKKKKIKKKGRYKK